MWWIVGLFAVLLVLPFAMLTAYVVPSTDDYMFAYFTDKLGIFESVKSFYLTWTGRYGSMFLLSLHPLSLGSLFLYRLLTFFLFLISSHSLYFFLRKVFGFTSRLQAAVLSLVFLFVYITTMPDMVQGFYWMPGNITYQLSNVLMLYFSGSIFSRLQSGPMKMGSLLGAAHVLLIVVICGLSEVSFLLMNILIGSFIFYHLLVHKRLNSWLIAFLICAVVCAVIVVLAPGAEVRVNADAVEIENRSALESISMSVTSLARVSLYWLQSLNLWMFSLVFLLVLATDSVSNERIFVRLRAIHVAAGLIWGILFLLVSVVPMHYVFGDLTPFRAVNVTYWIFLILWLFILYAVFQWVVILVQSWLSRRAATYVMVCLMLMIAGSGYSSRYYIAWNDWLSGRAAELDKQFHERHQIMQNCTTDHCEFPNYSVFPKTIFNEDFGRFAGSDFTIYFANYYNRISSNATFAEPEFVNRFESDLEGEKPTFLRKWETLSNRVSRSGSYSSLVHEHSEYSVTIAAKFSELQPANIHLLSRSEVTVYTLCEVGLCEAKLIFSIEDAQGNTVFWHAQPIKQEANESREWIPTHTSRVLPDGLIHPDMTAKVYVWNNRPNPIYVDDLELIIY